MNVVININDLLFHSKGSKTDSNGRNPVFFTNTHKLVMNYVHKNKGNTCHVYVNKRRRLLIVIGNNRNLEIKRMIDYIISKNKETGIIIYHIIRIFYGYCDNIEDIIQSIAYLRINIPYIHSIINYQVNHNIKDKIASFTVPLGSTLNMDGTAIMQGVATIFIANIYGFDLSLSDFISIIITASLFLSTSKLQYIGKIWILLILKVLNVLCGISCNQRGVENLPNTPFVIAANHQSPWESFFLQTLFIPTSSIMKKEILKANMKIFF